MRETTTEAPTAPRAAVLRQGTVPNLAVCFAGFALGVAGWVWDWAGHLHYLPAYEPGHLVMGVGLALVALSLTPWDRSWMARVLRVAMLAGLLAYAVAPEVGALAALAVLLAVVGRSLRRRRRDGRPWSWADAPLVATLVLIGGTVVDGVWHFYNPVPDDGFQNIAVLPGHLTMLAGILLGLAGTVALMRRADDTTKAVG